MPARPPVTWGRVKEWARRNEVPGSALIEDDEGRTVHGIDYRPDLERLYLQSNFSTGGAATWESLQAAAAEASVPDEALVLHLGNMGDPAVYVVDLGQADEGTPGVHRFILQRRWG
jgi:hypothetical protein